MSAFEKLMAHQRVTETIGGVTGRLGWDQETMMPENAANLRGEEMAAMETVLHARRTDPQIGEWLAQIDKSTLDAIGQANVREIQKSYERSTKVPADLAAEIAKTTSLSHRTWAKARAAEDYAAFAPALTEVLNLKRQEAAALSDGGDAYDAMLQDYEPGITGADLKQMFDEMRPRIVELAGKILDKPSKSQELTISFDEAKQLDLSQELAVAFGYDLSRGRIDKAVHPFSSGSGSDVRITTRTSASDPFNCIYSTIHETGHACYEQGVDEQHALTILGNGVSMGVHESQSRIYENQLGRSKAFTSHLFARMQSTFGDFGPENAESFYATVNKVSPGYIRTEADEVHYNLHIMLRFDLERALISGDLTVKDLPTAWNDRFLADFGQAVDKPSHGVLQDVHWSAGLFGYFPTYSLGNVYAGCLYQALSADISNLAEQLASGDTSAATSWLNKHLQNYGGLRLPKETIAHATGQSPTTGPLLDYLEAKFTELYDL